MEVLTIQQLDNWMSTHCYNDSYAIAGRTIHEGYGLAQVDDGYVWYYTERGVRRNLNHFPTEREAVSFAFKAIVADKSANRHLVGFLSDSVLEQALVTELEARRVPYWKDEIPYGGRLDPRSRLFVFGCDIHKVLDLQKEYGLIR